MKRLEEAKELLNKANALLTQLIAEQGTENKIEDTEIQTTKKEGKEKATEMLTMLQLNELTLKDLKELATEHGVAVRGNKTAIIGRLVEKLGLDEETEDEEEVDEEIDSIEDESVEEDNSEDEMSLEDELNELTDEDLTAICENAGIKVKGKKQTKISKIVKAIEDGEITLEDLGIEVVEEDYEDDAEEIDLHEVLADAPLKKLKLICKELDIKVSLKDKHDAVIDKLIEHNEHDAVIDKLIEHELIQDEETEDEEEVDVEYEGSSERVSKCIEVYELNKEEVDAGDVEDADIKAFFKEYYEGNKSAIAKMNKVSKEDRLEEYLSIIANLVDNTGEEVDLGVPYAVDEDEEIIYCCGKAMKDVEGTWTCEVCGEQAE